MRWLFFLGMKEVYIADEVFAILRYRVWQFYFYFLEIFFIFFFLCSMSGARNSSYTHHCQNRRKCIQLYRVIVSYIDVWKFKKFIHFRSWKIWNFGAWWMGEWSTYFQILFSFFFMFILSMKVNFFWLFSLLLLLEKIFCYNFLENIQLLDKLNFAEQLQIYIPLCICSAYDLHYLRKNKQFKVYNLVVAFSLAGWVEYKWICDTESHITLSVVKI